SRASFFTGLRTGVIGDRGNQARLRRILVVCQVALGLLLVTGASLFLRTLHNLRQTDTGFRSDHLIQFNLNAGSAGYNRERSEILFRQILEDLRHMPGVEAATTSMVPLLINSRIGFSLDVEGYVHNEQEN